MRYLLGFTLVRCSCSECRVLKLSLRMFMKAPSSRGTFGLNSGRLGAAGSVPGCIGIDFSGSGLFDGVTTLSAANSWAGVFFLAALTPEGEATGLLLVPLVRVLGLSVGMEDGVALRETLDADSGDFGLSLAGT